MSYIGVTYGYNMYSIFNTDSNTQPLTDIIVKVCFENLRTKLPERIKFIEREIEIIKNEEESLNKYLNKLNTDKIKEEEKAEEARKLELSPEKDKETKDKKTNTKEVKKPPAIKGKLNKLTNPNSDNIIQNIVAEIEKTTNTLAMNSLNKEKYLSKLKQLEEQNSYYKNIDENKIKIDLIDSKGERVDLEIRDNSYASTYLKDKECYELALLTTSKFLFNDIF